METVAIVITHSAWLFGVTEDGSKGYRHEPIATLSLSPLEGVWKLGGNESGTLTQLSLPGRLKLALLLFKPIVYAE